MPNSGILNWRQDWTPLSPLWSRAILRYLHWLRWLPRYLHWISAYICTGVSILDIGLDCRVICIFCDICTGVDAAISALVAEERNPDPVRNYRRLRKKCIRTWHGLPRLRGWMTGDI